MSKKKDSFWGMGFNLYGLWDKKPIKMFRYETFGNFHGYYSRGGNLSCPNRGRHKRNIYTIGSDNKKDIQDFIYWADNTMRKLLEVAESDLKIAKESENKAFIHAAEAVFNFIKNAKT